MKKLVTKPLTRRSIRRIFEMKEQGLDLRTIGLKVGRSHTDVYHVLQDFKGAWLLSTDYTPRGIDKNDNKSKLNEH